jgi:C1A family cysteine protease
MSRKTPSGRGLGWRPQLPDHRDALYTHQTPLAIAKALPKVVDLRGACPPVYDQGELGSCTGNGTAFLLHFDLLRENLITPDHIGPSRLAIYYGARALEGDIPQDAGAEVRDAVKTTLRGVVFEDLWPYDVRKFAQKPPPYTREMKDRTMVYRPVAQNSTAIRGCLASGYPIVFGFTCFPELDNVGRDGYLSMPSPHDPVMGGHCGALVGYMDAPRRYIVRNSWGPRWGDAGYFYMPYEYVHRADLSADFWMVQTVG